MKINVENLKIEVIKLKKLINKYEKIFLNLYNEISSCAIYWDDTISRNFFENVNKEKLQIKNTINELSDIKEIYEEIIKKYEMIGNKIDVIPQSKIIILKKVNNYLDKISQIIESYQEINLNLYPSEANIIYTHLNKLIKIKNNMMELKEKIANQYDLIEKIEKQISLKISKIKIEYIKEKEINKFI